MEFKLSNEEEIIFREIQALAGDLQQISENLVRHLEQRAKYAEKNKKEAELNKDAKNRVIGFPMMGMNRPALLYDLHFLDERFSSLIRYIEGPQGDNSR